jgi:hypothetical protein
MDLKEISSFVKNFASTLEAQEKFALPIIAAKARREAKANQTDIPLITASQVLTKMAANKDFISRQELQNVVNSYNASHSGLSSVFAEELGAVSKAQVKTFKRDEHEGKKIEHDYNKLADPVLANALSGVFAKTPTSKVYSSDMAKRAERAAYSQLLALGIEPKEVSAFTGKEDMILCQASHETPKGYAHSLIPVEIKDNKALLPQLFLTASGFVELEKVAYLQHLLSVTGVNLKVNADKILEAFEQIKTGQEEPVNIVELAAIKLASETGTLSIDPNALYLQPEEETVKDVELLKMPATEESKFAETLAKPEGIARFIHGDKVTDSGRDMLTRKFASMGYRNVQIKVADVEQDKIYYAVGLGVGTGLKVPVEIVNKIVLEPKIVFANDMVSDFTKESLNEIVKAEDGGNKRALAMVSPCHGLNASELLTVVKESISEGNYLRAEDAINVLAEVDVNTQKIAIAHLAMVLNESKGSKENTNHMQKLASQKVNDTPQFMSYKIFFPEGV